VSSQLLTFLKYIFLAVLYLFFARVLRAVWAEIREPPLAADGTGALAADPAADAPTRINRPGAPNAGALVVVEPSDRSGARFGLSDELTVGRAAGCGVSLPDDSFVSQLHGRVFRRDGSLFVEDLGSTNGTWLNGGRVSGPTRMHDGDRLQVGRTVLELQE
jgi:hypothetical protein